MDFPDAFTAFRYLHSQIRKREYNNCIVYPYSQNKEQPALIVFSIFFKETMGKSFSSYLEKLRLEKAKKLIAEGKWDMETIAQMVGYGSSATFRRAFKRAYGIAPSAWKE
mgnify:CR=1 FL=1